MIATEIKKLYTKTKKAYEKRTGEKYTWVMNAAQQRKGTATVCTDYVLNYDELLRSAEQSLANFEQDWAKQVADYAKRAKKEAWQNEHTPGWYFGKNDDFWQKVMEPEHLEGEKARTLESRKRHRDKMAAKLEEHGTYKHYLKTSLAHAREMINSPEIQSFLQEIGGMAQIETKETGNGTEIHIRFHYKPTAA